MLTNMRTMLLTNMRTMLLTNMRTMLLTNMRTMLLTNMRTMLLTNMRTMLSTNLSRDTSSMYATYSRTDTGIDLMSRRYLDGIFSTINFLLFGSYLECVRHLFHQVSNRRRESSANRASFALRGSLSTEKRRFLLNRSRAVQIDASK